MNKFITIAALGLLTSTAWAADTSMSGNQEMYGNPLMDHNQAERAHAVQREVGDNYGSLDIKQPADHVDQAEVASTGYTESNGDS